MNPLAQIATGGGGLDLGTTDSGSVMTQTGDSFFNFGGDASFWSDVSKNTQPIGMTSNSNTPLFVAGGVVLVAIAFYAGRKI